MMKKILCFAAVLALFAAVPAAAETAQPVTAEELGALLENVRTEALAAAPLNDPANEDAQSEDGTLFLYEVAWIYADATALTAETPVNALVFESCEGPVFRGLGIDSHLDDVLAAFPSDNADMAGSREAAVLYLKNTDEGGFVYGRILRDGQRIAAAEYGEVLPAGDDFHCAAVTFSMQEGLVSSIRVDGLNPESGRMDAPYANEFLTELKELAARDDYRAVKTSRVGTDLTAFDESDLVFGGIDYTALKPDTLPGATEQELLDNDDGTWLLCCNGEGYEAVFTCEADGGNAKILSFAIRDDQLEGPRGVRLGDQFSEDFCRFRSGENEMGEDMTEVLYGILDAAPYGFASYDPDDMNLRYAATLQDGTDVELLLRYEDNYLTEILIQSI